VSAQTDIEAATRALDPVEREAKLKQALDKAKGALLNEKNLRALDVRELTALRNEVASLRKSNGLMAVAIERATPPDFSASEVDRAKADAAKAEQAKDLAEAARDAWKNRGKDADKARSAAEADAAHTEKHADRRVREAEKDRDDALAKADSAFKRGVERGVNTMQRAFTSALFMEKRGAAPGSIVALNEAKEPIDDRVMDKAWSLVGKLADLRDDDK
jgi:hypothetical protein